MKESSPVQQFFNVYEEEIEERSPVQQFLDEYKEKVEILRVTAWAAFSEAYTEEGESYPYDFFRDVEEKITAFQSLCRIEHKIRELQKARGRCKTDFRQLSLGRQTSGPSEKFEDFQRIVEDVIQKGSEYAETSVQRAERILEDILVCPFGAKENKNQNALFFQDKALDFLDWLFVDEMERIDLREIERGKLRRDGSYRVLDQFDTQKRCGFPFRFVIVECKNFCRPNHLSLMQLFIYTMNCQAINQMSPTLGLLISRECPSDQSMAWLLRQALFNKRLRDQTQVILFLDMKDFKMMCEQKRHGFDAAGILKEKIMAIEQVNFGGNMWL
jgi:hypothetical protein